MLFYLGLPLCFFGHRAENFEKTRIFSCCLTLKNTHIALFSYLVVYLRGFLVSPKFLQNFWRNFGEKIYGQLFRQFWRNRQIWRFCEPCFFIFNWEIKISKKCIKKQEKPIFHDFPKLLAVNLKSNKFHCPYVFHMFPRMCF